MYLPGSPQALEARLERKGKNLFVNDVKALKLERSGEERTIRRLGLHRREVELEMWKGEPKQTMHGTGAGGNILPVAVPRVCWTVLKTESGTTYYMIHA